MASDTNETNAAEKSWIGFDLGGTKMLATVFNAKFEIVGRNRKRTQGAKGVEAGLEKITRTIRAALEDAGRSPDSLAGIGIGCPGPVDFDNGVMLEAPNLGWFNVPLKQTLEETFGCPVIVANDVDAGTYGEYRFGAGKGGRCVLGVFPGTGIGGGCVYDGQVIRGKLNSCMEIGHIPLMPSGPLSGSDVRGTVERLASRLAISAAAAQAAYRGEAPHLMKAVGTDVSKIRSGPLAEAIANGDTVIERIVREAAELIGVAIAGVIHLLAPDIIVLGGGLVEAMPEIFLEEVKLSARKTVLSTFTDSFEVHAASLGDDASVMGAAAWAQSEVEGKS